jgi:hypothetical protein
MSLINHRFFHARLRDELALQECKATQICPKFLNELQSTAEAVVSRFLARVARNHKTEKRLGFVSKRSKKSKRVSAQNLLSL